MYLALVAVLASSTESGSAFDPILAVTAITISVSFIT